MKGNSIEEDIKRIEYIFEFQTKMNCSYVLETEDEKAIEHILSDYKRLIKENEEFRKFLIKIISEYIPDWELEELVDRYKNESFIPRVEMKKILEDRRKQMW